MSTPFTDYQLRIAGAQTFGALNEVRIAYRQDPHLLASEVCLLETATHARENEIAAKYLGKPAPSL